MKPLYFAIASVIALSSATFTACQSNSMSSESIETTLRQAEEAIVMGDMTAAESVASYLSADTALRKAMSTTQLARLSMVYVQIADSLDQETNTNRAADFYDMAYHANSDSADAFYRDIEPSQLQYVVTLANHSANRANPVDISSLPDEMEEAAHANASDSHTH